MESPGPITEQERVEGWRFEECDRLGCSPGVSLAVSKLTAFELDLHKLAELIRQGCAPDTAARVLSPVDLG